MLRVLRELVEITAQSAHTVLPEHRVTPVLRVKLVLRVLRVLVAKLAQSALSVLPETRVLLVL